MALISFWLPKCASMRSRPGLVEPDVYIRMVHSAQVGRNNVPVATYREHTVEVALEAGEFTSQGDIATREGNTRARVTQITGVP